MVTRRHRRGIFRRMLRMARDVRGVAAVEFAMILPLMLVIYIGGNEFGHALTISRKVTHVASTVADLVAQAKSVSNSDVTSIMTIADAMMEPHSSSTLSIRITLIAIDEDGEATVAWSKANANTTALTAGADIVIPDSVKVPSTYLVNAEVHYPYTPRLGYVLTGSLDLEDEFYLSPRLSDDVKNPPNYN